MRRFISAPKTMSMSTFTIVCWFFFVILNLLTLFLINYQHAKINESMVIFVSYVTLSNTVVYLNKYLSCDLRFPTMWYVRPAKPQISLRIRAVWSEPFLVAWIFNECKFTDWTSFGISKLKRRLNWLVYTCQNATLLEITCHGSFLIRVVRKRRDCWIFFHAHDKYYKNPFQPNVPFMGHQ